MLLVGAVILIKPDSVFNLLRSSANSLGLHVVAVVVRLVLGVALITYAVDSRYPIILAVIGWISLAAAIILGVMGHSKFQRLMAWALSLVSSYGRVGGLLVIVFGGFLIHAVRLI